MTHTVSVLVENKPGALARVSNMFARRGFNIESLAVGSTERRDVSRIMLTVDCEDELESVLEEAMACGRTAVVDARCDPAEKCFPMIPAGAAAVDVIEASEEEPVPA